MKESAQKPRFQSPLAWGKAACDVLMQTYTPPQLPPERTWHYHQGVFLYGMLHVWYETGQKAYWDYIKGYVDDLVDAQGNLLFARGELDAIQAGLLLFPLDRETEDPRYVKAAGKLRRLFDILNQTQEGGYWHKDKYPYQMWLDGIYMGGVFACQYARAYGETALFDMVVKQEQLMRTHMKDDRTGLMYHAWDESRRTDWSDNETGCSPEFWGRAVGWYGMALNDILDQLPLHHPGRENLIQALQELVPSLVRFQDESSGLWYQVVDKGDHDDNWLETSCSSLFVYTMTKAVRKGYVDPTYLEPAQKGFQGLTNRIDFNADDRLILPDICVGTGVGDYRHYVQRPKSENDLHGAGAFILAAVEMERALSRPD